MLLKELMDAVVHASAGENFYWVWLQRIERSM